MAKIKKIFLDTETTGLDKNIHGVHQISGAIQINGNFVESFDFKFRPYDGCEFTEEAMTTCGLTKEEILSRTLSEKEAYQLFHDLLIKHVNKFNKEDKFFFYAYNARFDFEMLIEMFLRNDDKYFFSFFWTNLIDIMSLASEALVNERHKISKFKLLNVAKALNIRIDEKRLHEAIYDVSVMLEVYNKCLTLLYHNHIGIATKLSEKGKKLISEMDAAKLDQEIEQKQRLENQCEYVEEKNTKEATDNYLKKKKSDDVANAFLNPTELPQEKVQKVATKSLNKIDDLNYVMEFGKYKDKTIEFILKNGAQYIIWLHDNVIKGIQFSNTIMSEAVRLSETQKRDYHNPTNHLTGYKNDLPDFDPQDDDLPF